MQYLLVAMMVMVMPTFFGAKNVSSNKKSVSKHTYSLVYDVVKKQISEDQIRQDVFMKILFLRPYQSLQQAQKIANVVATKSIQYNIDPDLVLGIIRIESYFRIKARSKVGARGLMQVMPLWLAKNTLCEKKNLWDVEQNIDCGIQIYQYYLQMFSDQRLALIAYNRGPRPVKRALRKGQDPDNGYAIKIMHQVNRLKKINYYLKSFEIHPQMSASL